MKNEIDRNINLFSLGRTTYRLVPERVQGILYSNGQKSSEGFLEQGKPNGYWKNYYETGILKSEGNRKDFQLDSTWKFFRVDGSLQQSIEYKENLKYGLECFYDSLGRKERSITYKSDVKEGPASEYFPSGGVKTFSVTQIILLKGNILSTQKMVES